jgi:CorA-like Mg2+ transporter protein
MLASAAKAWVHVPAEQPDGHGRQELHREPLLRVGRRAPNDDHPGHRRRSQHHQCRNGGSNGDRERQRRARTDKDRLRSAGHRGSSVCRRSAVGGHHPRPPEIRKRYAKRKAPIDRPSLLLYRIIDGLVDSFFPILADFDDRIDDLENAIFTKADDKQLQEIFQMKRLLVGMRKAVTPQRDAFASLMGA